jgi:flagellar biosynthesis protein FlhB
MVAAWQPERFGGEDPFHFLNELVRLAGDAALVILLPTLVALFAGSALTMILQVRPLFAIQVLSPTMERLNPMEGLRRMFFASQTWRHNILGVAKFCVLLIMTAMTVWSSLKDLILSSRLGIDATVRIFGSLVAALVWKTAALYLLFGVADYFIQRTSFMKQHRMTDEELKEEQRFFERSPESRQRSATNWTALLAQIRGSAPTKN